MAPNDVERIGSGPRGLRPSEGPADLALPRLRDRPVPHGGRHGRDPSSLPGRADRLVRDRRRTRGHGLRAGGADTAQLRLVRPACTGSLGGRSGRCSWWPLAPQPCTPTSSATSAPSSRSRACSWRRGSVSSPATCWSSAAEASMVPETGSSSSTAGPCFGTWNPVGVTALALSTAVGLLFAFGGQNGLFGGTVALDLSSWIAFAVAFIAPGFSVSATAAVHPPVDGLSCRKQQRQSLCYA